ncbi:DUF1801 domain-containing protein [Occultella glacieicola]|uniref:DUF1801 domain-containing protein n=1 Tax=Occultella glacieicola TaxID=2518684 RepID=A0ABY2EAT7_9MICO|nr:DUF1801 domain-containing protein [Occultella glacieicola]TDE97334.1 DUF1801 domain-containing protein [Occultella glacieicola]
MSIADGLDASLVEVVERLRELVAETLPDAVEEQDVTSGLIGYTYKPGTYKHLIAGIVPHRGHVNLMLANGAELVDLDPAGLLAGTGTRARHIRFVTAADVARPGVRELLAEAARRTPRP